jgi:uncharacterized protein with NRDE domain
MQNPHANTVIYKIVCNDSSIKEGYIGHTIDFEHRKSEHKSYIYNENGKKYNFKLYSSIRANGGWDNYSMLIVENYPCNNSNEARKKEQEYYEILNSDLNSRRPYEKAVRVIDKLEQKDKYEEKKDEINKIRRQKLNCECGIIISNSSKYRHFKSPVHMKYCNTKNLEKIA